MIPTSQYLGRIIIALGVFMLLYMSLFGIFNMNMSMTMDGQTSDCPLMLGMNICPMTPFEHISFMQNFFTNIPNQQNMTLVLLLALSFLAGIGLAWLRQLVIPPDRFRSVGYFYRNRYIPIQGFLQHLFSQGILNPKLY